MRFQIFLAAWGLVGLFVFGYVAYGSAADLGRKLLEDRRRRTLAALSVLLFEADDDAAAVHQAVGRLPNRVLIDVIQSLAIDLQGQAKERLLELTRVSGLQRSIIRRVSSRRWRLRVQGAQLQYLVVDPSFDRSILLKDRHALVRARSAESLSDAQGEQFLDLLLEMLGDPAIVVRLAAQQKILDIGTPAVPALQRHLRTNRQHLVEVLELAANLADPRLVKTLEEHAASRNASLRAMTATALGHGVGRLATPILLRLANDEDADVRTAALTSLGLVGDLGSVTEVGSHLSDGAWSVRRSSGVALDQMGSAGRMVLRQNLSNADPFARDMARQVLDSASQRGLPGPPPLVDPLSDDERELVGADGVSVRRSALPAYRPGGHA